MGDASGPALLAVAHVVHEREPMGMRGIGRMGDVAPDEGFFSRLARRVQRERLDNVALKLGLLSQ